MLQLCENLESENIAKTFRTTKQHDKDALVIAGGYWKDGSQDIQLC